MLSIGKIGGNGGYYLDLAQEDYYLKGGEPLGQWWGRGAAGIVGRGTVERDQLQSLLGGFSPDGEALTQCARWTDKAQKDHQRGWDLTFSAPKSVSVLWSQWDHRTQTEIQAAHSEAVQAALSYLQDEASFTRRGRGGHVWERVGLAVAMYEHGTSRAMDPTLHTHCLVMNVGLREDGTTGTILSKPLYQAKMTAGALYRAELANQLEKRLGCICEREAKGGSFSVKHVLKSLCDEFSKRRAEIEEKLTSIGFASAAAAAFAALDTRRAKEDVPPRSELFSYWRAVAEPFGFKPEDALNQRTATRDVKKDFSAALDGALSEITGSQSHFTEMELLRAVAVESQGRGISSKDIRENVKAELSGRGGEIVMLGTQGGQTRYTTEAVLATEKSLIDAASRLDANKDHGGQQETIETVLASKGQHLSDEQREAVRHLTQRGGGLRSLEGAAGTGKTSTLSVAREVLEKSGYHVIGTTLSAKAAKELAKGAQIQSNTIALLELKMQEPGMTDILKHEGKQLARAAIDKGRCEMFKPLQFTDKTVLVIDESAMVATKELAKLTAAVTKAGGMLISVFDRNQLQAIGPGGGAAYLADKFGKADLTGIVRQHEEWMRDAAKQFARGDAAAALKQYELAGRLHVVGDREQAASKLVSDWMVKEKGHREDALIFVGTRDEAAKLNERCQTARREAGELGATPVRAGENAFYPGDRVLFTKNSKSIGVQNGTLGTVSAFAPEAKIAVVRLDSGGTAMVPLHSYKSMQLGYAVTTHKGQGTTVENAYLLAGGAMQDRHLAYVQASRARESTFIYADRQEAGDKLDELAKQMSKEREKTLAHDIAERAQHELHQSQTIEIRQERRI